MDTVSDTEVLDNESPLLPLSVLHGSTLLSFLALNLGSWCIERCVQLLERRHGIKGTLAGRIVLSCLVVLPECVLCASALHTKEVDFVIASVVVGSAFVNSTLTFGLCVVLAARVRKSKSITLGVHLKKLFTSVIPAASLYTLASALFQYSSTHAIVGMVLLVLCLFYFCYTPGKTTKSRSNVRPSRISTTTVSVSSRSTSPSTPEADARSSTLPASSPSSPTLPHQSSPTWPESPPSPPPSLSSSYSSSSSSSSSTPADLPLASLTPGSSPSLSPSLQPHTPSTSPPLQPLPEPSLPPVLSTPERKKRDITEISLDPTLNTPIPAVTRLSSFARTHTRTNSGGGSITGSPFDKRGNDGGGGGGGLDLNGSGITGLNGGHDDSNLTMMDSSFELRGLGDDGEHPFRLPGYGAFPGSSELPVDVNEMLLNTIGYLFGGVIILVLFSAPFVQGLAGAYEEAVRHRHSRLVWFYSTLVTELPKMYTALAAARKGNTNHIDKAMTDLLKAVVVKLIGIQSVFLLFGAWHELPWHTAQYSYGLCLVAVCTLTLSVIGQRYHRLTHTHGTLLLTLFAVGGGVLLLV
eukprot:TRINITY_DN1414_c1_g1_i1.p1 TRINITY_DN1414_c1_g1~~TRINITY_DN1414_c1_g1_i1.p1  ORF type:complete len:580 (+),score=84.77 TRINITY_DN1414_c1_g1_i1:333-2072(+)